MSLPSLKFSFYPSKIYLSSLSPASSSSACFYLIFHFFLLPPPPFHGHDCSLVHDLIILFFPFLSLHLFTFVFFFVPRLLSLLTSCPSPSSSFPQSLSFSSIFLIFFFSLQVSLFLSSSSSPSFSLPSAFSFNRFYWAVMSYKLLKNLCFKYFKYNIAPNGQTFSLHINFYFMLNLMQMFKSLPLLHVFQCCC